MENENENFDQLTKLLSLKKHEQPPPGYFNKLPSNVISRIRAEKAVDFSPVAKLRSEAPWLLRFWEALDTKPLFAGAVGAAACALVLVGVYHAESPRGITKAAAPLGASAGRSLDGGGGSFAGVSQGMMLADTNLPPSGINLFDLVQPSLAMPDRTFPASFSPGGTN